MKNSYEWYAVINDTERHITCEAENGTYMIAVDGTAAASEKMKSKGKLSREGIEIPFQVDGTECRFIIWNNLPDLSVDGMLMSCDKPYKEVRRQIAINTLSQCLSSALVGIVVLILVTVGFLTKKLTVYAYVPVLIPCAIFIARALVFFIKYKAFVKGAKAAPKE